MKKKRLFFSKLLCKSSLILALCSFPLSYSFALTCSDSESLKTFMEKGDYRGALQNMDTCLSVQKQPSQDDQNLFNDLIKQVLSANDSISFNDGYRNFQAVLKIRLLNNLKFKLKSDFEKHPKKDAKLFSKVRDKGEKYYFYYDTGRMLSYSRGIALTDQSLLWKNMTGKPHRFAFNEIKSIKLVYKRGLSLTGWQLIVNNDKNNNVRLSKMPDDTIIPFVSAMIYFININQTSSDKVQFIVDEREMGILAGWVTLCSEKRVEHKNPNPIKELQLMEACFSTYGKGFSLSQTDNELLKKLTKQIFEKSESEQFSKKSESEQFSEKSESEQISKKSESEQFSKKSESEQISKKSELSLAEGYNNFKVVLSTHFFSKLKFKFKNNLGEDNLFKAVHKPEESDYFYFDTGKMVSASRGLLLTDKAIIWKNLLGTSISWKKLTGTASRLAFDKVSSVTLVHEVSIKSVMGWKLRLNQNKDYEIVLSKLSDENVELFASAFVYFINIASNANLTLEIPAKTQDVLTKSFLERHPKIKSMTDSVFGLFSSKDAKDD